MIVIALRPMGYGVTESFVRKLEKFSHDGLRQSVWQSGNDHQEEKKISSPTYV